MQAKRVLLVCAAVFALALGTNVFTQSIGSELSMARRLADGEEFDISLRDLVEHGGRLFAANWTSQEGGGRPQTKGTGGPLSDPSDPLVFPRNFNRVSAPDANSCAAVTTLRLESPEEAATSSRMCSCSVTGSISRPSA